MNKYFKFEHGLFGDFYTQCDENKKTCDGEDDSFRGDSIKCALMWHANQLIARTHYGNAGDRTLYDFVVINDKFGYVTETAPDDLETKHYVRWLYPADQFCIENQIQNRDKKFMEIMKNAVGKSSNVRLSKRTGLPIFDIAFPKFMVGGDIDTWIGSSPYLSEDSKIAAYQMRYAGLI